MKCQQCVKWWELYWTRNKPQLTNDAHAYVPCGFYFHKIPWSDVSLIERSRYIPHPIITKTCFHEHTTRRVICDITSLIYWYIMKIQCKPDLFVCKLTTSLSKHLTLKDQVVKHVVCVPGLNMPNDLSAIITNISWLKCLIKLNN